MGSYVISRLVHFFFCRCGGIGRHAVLRGSAARRAGSTRPSAPFFYKTKMVWVLRFVYNFVPTVIDSELF